VLLLFLSTTTITTYMHIAKHTKKLQTNQPKTGLEKKKCLQLDIQRSFPQAKQALHGASKQAVRLLGESAPTLVSPWLKKTPT
jgi:hypothetical protein